MDNNQKGLVDDNREGFILNESGTTVKTDDNEKQENVQAEEGSKSDPQLTEFDGLLKGGVEPHVHPEDLQRKKEDPETGR